MAAKGLRVLAAAEKNAGSKDVDPYGDLSFLGLIGMQDPPRQDVPDAVRACRDAGVRVVMVTGDHSATAGKVAEQVGITRKEAKTRIIEGFQLNDAETVSESEEQELIQANVFARVSPRQKLDLIKLHQGKGAVVAMTGDGVNDAPALKKADIGIAMGRRGTQVAREAADMVLQDDAFGTIVAAVAQGRAIFENIRKFILFLLSGNVGEILIVGVAIMAGAPLPLLPLQILYLNMIGDVFPALALAVGKGDQTAMQQKPRDMDESMLTRGHWLAIGAYGALIAASVLTAFFLSLHALHLETHRAVMVSFLSLSFARLWHVFNMRRPASGIVDNEIVRNLYIWASLLICCSLLLAAIYLPGLAGILKLSPPAGVEWGLILGFSLLPLIGGQAAIVALRFLK